MLVMAGFWFYQFAINFILEYFQTLGALDPFFNLKNLYLYKNNIRRIQGLEALTSLEMLDLSRNNVERIDNLENCPKLRTL